MQDAPLLIRDILMHGQQVHGDSSVITVEEGGHRVATFAEVATRAEKLAAALTRLGIEQGDRVGTFCWNNQGHLEAYLAIPCMGAVLHTLNIRLPADQLAYVVNHAEDRCIIVDASLIPLLAAIRDELKTVETIIVVGEGDTSALGETLSYERLLAAVTQDPNSPLPAQLKHDLESYYSDPGSPIVTKKNAKKWKAVESNLKILTTMSTTGNMVPISHQVLDPD